MSLFTSKKRFQGLLVTFGAFMLVAGFVPQAASAQASTLTINIPWGICGNTAAQGNQGFDCVHPPSSLRFDPVTANKVCSVHGYRTVVRMSDNQDGRTGYSSPGNNGIIHWNGSSWVKQNARAAGNHWLASITCGDPIGQCEDAKDNDADGFTDREDPDCYDADGEYNPQNREDTKNSHNQCVDTEDNEGDGFIDFDDPDCHSDNDPNDGDDTFVPENEEDTDNSLGQCEDTLDNDSDGFTDREDPDCYDSNGSYNPDNDEDTNNSHNQCVDGSDNDSDNTIDQGDDGCHSDGDANDGDDTFVPSEDELPKADDTTVGQCADEKDNEGDGFEDRQDPDCYDSNGNYNPDNDEDTNNTHNQCIDKLDNDGDKLIDFSDPDCHSDGDATDGDDSFVPSNREHTKQGQVAAAVQKPAPVKVPVTAKTGAGSLALVSTLAGAAGLVGKRYFG